MPNRLASSARFCIPFEKRSSVKIRSERGNVLVEVVAFVALAFGLVLDAGLELFKLEKQQLQLSVVSRNSLREYMSNSSDSLAEIIWRWQSRSTEFSAERMEFNLVCLSDCDQKGSIVSLQLRSENLAVDAFAIEEH